MSEIDGIIDKKTEKLERKMAEIYRKAEKDLKEDIEAYFKQFEKADEEKKKALEAEEITKEEYKQWRIKTMMNGKEFEALKDKIAKRYLRANKEAAKLRNEAMLSIMAESYNYEAYKLESAVNG